MTLRDVSMRILALGLLGLPPLVLPSCGEREPSTKIFRLVGVEAAWNASKLLPGRALYKSQPVWEVAARPGDVLGMCFPDPEEEALDLWALYQGGAQLFFTVLENTPTHLEFSRKGSHFYLGETLVGTHLETKEMLTVLEQSSVTDLRSLRYLVVEDSLLPSQPILKQMDGSHLVVAVGGGLSTEELVSLNPYGLVCENGLPSSSDLDRIARLTNLHFLILDGFSELSALGQLPQIRTLIVPDTWLPDLEFLRGMPTLEAVAFHTENQQEVDLAPLGDLPELESLWALGSSTGLEQVQQELAVFAFPENTTDSQFSSFLRRNPHIQSLVLSDCDDLSTLEPLRSSTEIRALLINDCDPPDRESGFDLSPLASLHDLNLLAVIDSGELDGLASLHGLKNLRRLIVDENLCEEERVQSFAQALPDCEIIGFYFCMGSFWIVVVLAVAFAIGSVLRRYRSDPHP